jgi:Methylamine utilisation protein MauE
MSLDPFLVLTARYFLALLLLAAGLHKRAHMGSVTAAIAAYRVVPVVFEKPVAWLLIGVELHVATALMVPSASRLASLAAAGVFAVYFAVMGLSLVRDGREVECGCSFHHSDASLSASHLVRNLLLMIVAVAGSRRDSGRAVGWVDGVQIAAAVVCLALLYLSADALLAHPGSTAAREA